MALHDCKAGSGVMRNTAIQIGHRLKIRDRRAVLVNWVVSAVFGGKASLVLHLWKWRGDKADGC